MKILTLHCDYIKFKPLKKAIKNAEALAEKDEIKVLEPLVVLTAVEKNDTGENLKELVDAVVRTVNEVKAERVVLYPYAHLSSELAAPEKALKFLQEAELLLKKKDVEVIRAPFGYYKSFELKCKGHPLSELSKTFSGKTGSPTEENENLSQLLHEISRSKLDTSKLKDNDHRILGQKLDLFSFNVVAPGAVFWHNNGLIIYNELKSLIRDLLEKFEYQEIATPQILENKLFKVSGHWSHYKDNIFITKYEDRDFGVKPMNCPGAMLVFKSASRSYKELPLRLSEFGLVHRKELSGVLAGLFRVVQFTQDDAHIFCTKEQIKDEIEKMLAFVKIVYKDTFNLDYHFELSTRPEKFMGEVKDWDFSEKQLEEALKKSKSEYIVKKGAGAFYGPKIDIHIKDSLGRDWQCATIQLDMQMPQRFELAYADSDNKTKIPIVIHRAIFGSIERFIGILLEHLNGNLPLWLSPIQVRILNFTERNEKAARKIFEKIKKEINGIRADLDLDATTVSDKVRKAEMQRVPYIIVIGDKEEESGKLAVRARGTKPKFGVGFDDFVEEVKDKINQRKI